MGRIIPLSETATTVLLSRSDFEALLDAAGDAHDAAVFRAYDARIAAEGEAAVLADFITVEFAERIFAGESPVLVWREFRGLSREALAEAAGVSTEALRDIECGANAGALDAMERLGTALRIEPDALLP